jgi:hypothetical protein
VAQVWVRQPDVVAAQQLADAAQEGLREAERVLAHDKQRTGRSVAAPAAVAAVQRAPGKF